MGSVTISIKGIDQAVKKSGKEVKDLLIKADRKFKVASVRAEAYAKANATSLDVVETGFHRRNIRHDPNARFLSGSLTAFAKYASVLEFGFNGPVYVSNHTRRITQAFGQIIPAQTIPVSGHIRRMNRSARPHIVPAIERALKQLIEDLEAL